MKTKHLITTLAIGLLTLTACSNNDEPQNAEEAQQQYADELEEQGIDPMDGAGNMPTGEYEVYPEHGGHIVFDLPADNDNDELTEIEQYRQDAQADPVTYLVADVDNRDGTDSINMYQVAVFDEDGNKYEFSEVSNYISDISPSTDWDVDDGTYLLPNGERLSQKEGANLSRQSSELHNEYLYGASVGERKTLILVYEGDDLPDEFTRVAVWPNGALEEVDAYPAE